LLGDLLRALRGDRSVEEVAAALGVARSAIYHWEGGKRRPDPTNLGPLLEHYGATPEQQAEAWRLRAQPGAAVEASQGAA
jgi:transcriptional regulator with XRE-family HTH domain